MTDQNYAPPQAELIVPPMNNIVSRSTKVGGWLLLFCVGLTIISPLLTVAQIVTGYQQSSRYFTQFPGLLRLIIADTLLSIALMIFSISTGIHLWKIKPGAVALARKYLIALVIYHVATAIIPYVVGLPSKIAGAISGEIMGGTVKGFIYAAVWYSYLGKSKRVQETYHQ
jgi:hypothetical protein